MRQTISLLFAIYAAAMLLTLAAGTANAEDVEVSYEQGGSGHCPTATMSAGHVVGGGCRVHAVSESNAITLNHTGSAEAVTSSCVMELYGRIGENGEGWIEGTDAMIATNPAAGCVVTACDEASPSHAELEWPAHLEEVAPGVLQGHLTFCIRPFNAAEGVGNTPCTIEVTVTPIASSTDHDYEARATESPCAENPARETTGHWRSETVHNPAEENEGEVRHLP